MDLNIEIGGQKVTDRKQKLDEEKNQISNIGGNKDKKYEIKNKTGNCQNQNQKIMISREMTLH